MALARDHAPSRRPPAPQRASVRVARVNEISGQAVYDAGYPFASDLDVFKLDWDRQHGRGSFAESPWCWVLELVRKDGAE